MPPKNSNGKKATKNISDADLLDQMIAKNETEAGMVSTQKQKAGMTKAQQKEAESKAIEHSRANNGVSREHLQAYYQMQRVQEEQQQIMERESSAVNVFAPLPVAKKQWFKSSAGKYVRLEQFDGSEEKMSLCVNIFNSELTEPYVDFTYMHFMLGWKDLCVLAYEYDGTGEPAAATGDAPATGGKFVAAIVSSVARKAFNKPLRGYVAMLAVKPESRKNKIASVLVTASVDLMRVKNCDEVSLETPSDAIPALSLYTNLGFAKTKFLARYYLQGQDAYRLKLWLKPSANAESFKQQLARQQALMAKNEKTAAIAATADATD